MSASALNTETLHSAFEIFNQHSSQLETSYRELQEQVTLLSRQLRQAQSARLVERAKKDQVIRRSALLLNTLPGAIIVLDGDGVIRERNREAVELLNEPLSGCCWAEIVRREVDADCSEDGNIRLRDGRWLSLLRRPLHGEQGEILLLSDVSPSRRESPLRQRQERLAAIGEMTAKFAHDIRTPLASAVLYTSQLQSVNGSQQIIAAKISARLTDLGHMVDDMLRFAAGGKSADESVDVRSLFDSVSDTLREQLNAASTVNFVIDGTVVEPGSENRQSFSFSTNGAAVKGALINLVINADQAAAAGTHIQIGAWRDDRWVYLTVTDDGPGIEADVLPNIFNPFFTTRPQGTGLGLAVVRAVARAMGGEVSVQCLRKGARFTIGLPAQVRSDGEVAHA